MRIVSWSDSINISDMRVYSLTFGFNRRQLLHSQLLFMSAHSRVHTVVITLLCTTAAQKKIMYYPLICHMNLNWETRRFWVAYYATLNKQGVFSKTMLTTLQFNHCPAGNHMLKVNNRNTRMASFWCRSGQWHRSSVFIVNFERILHLALVFLLLTLSW